MKSILTHKHLLIFALFLIMPALLYARTRKGQEMQTLEDLLPSSEAALSPALWQKGMPFVLLRDNVGLTLQPESPEKSVADSLCQKGEVWCYDSMVSEEDWMGQELLQLRFVSPRGAAYRFSTGQPMSAISDKGYQPVLGCLYPSQVISQVDSVLRARTLYILINDERVFYPADTVVGAHHEKYVPVVVDSVSSGNELAPLAVYFHRADADPLLGSGYFYASLPGSRENGTSTSLERFLAVDDPYLLHPDITPEIWTKIKNSSVQLDMTSEEVRLSWGRPLKVEKGASRNGMVEFWYYSNNRVLQIWDGRLYKMGVL